MKYSVLAFMNPEQLTGPRKDYKIVKYHNSIE